MKLWAISDLHVGHVENRRAVEQIVAHPTDWLILGGDLGETADHLRFVIDTLGPRFKRLVWIPGNHELWTTPGDGSVRGVAKYERLVALCQASGVLTPEDPYATFDDGGERFLIAPLFVLYDYSFCPDGLTPLEARAWALEAGLECVDEHLLHFDPHPSREAWCAARCDYSAARLATALASHDGPSVLVNHFPLRRDHAVLPAIPRFSIWCGTRRTEDWHRRFRARAVVYGHLHIPQTRLVDDVAFHEVSLGYPRQWRHRRLERPEPRQILPRLGPPR